MRPQFLSYVHFNALGGKWRRRCGLPVSGVQDGVWFVLINVTRLRLGCMNVADVTLYAGVFTMLMVLNRRSCNNRTLLCCMYIICENQPIEKTRLSVCVVSADTNRRTAVLSVQFVMHRLSRWRCSPKWVSPRTTWWRTWWKKWATSTIWRRVGPPLPRNRWRWTGNASDTTRSWNCTATRTESPFAWCVENPEPTGETAHDAQSASYQVGIIREKSRDIYSRNYATTDDFLPLVKRRRRCFKINIKTS